jgi:hypothetical protein
MYINDIIMQVRNSGHAKIRMYRTQTIIAKVLDGKGVLYL